MMAEKYKVNFIGGKNNLSKMLLSKHANQNITYLFYNIKVQDATKICKNVF